MTHLKRYSMPGFWPVEKKKNIFVIKPMPGPHSKNNYIPLRVVLRDVLKYAENAKEAKDILIGGKVLVDKKVRKEPKFPVGLMDVIEIPESKQYFRVVVDKKGLFLQGINESDAGKKLCKINGKSTVKGGICQLSLHDGRNVLVKKDTYKVGDTIVISVPDQKILKHHVFQRGEKALIIAGRNIGVTGKIKDVQKRENMLEKSTVTLETGAGDIQTLRDYILVGDV
jgi:small subunit ribosomal protein S4e